MVGRKERALRAMTLSIALAMPAVAGSAVPDAVRAIDAGDCQRAGEEINRGIDRNDAQAYFLAGLLLENSGCMRSDAAKAARYYQKAVELGDPTAADFLGTLYGTGRGVPQDYAAAYRLYAKPRDGLPALPDLDGDQARVAGYAHTVAHLAKTRTKYPRVPERDGTEATLFAVFEPATGKVTFEQVRANAVTGSNVPKPQAFLDELTRAYAAAVEEVPRTAALQSTRLLFRTSWSFKLQRSSLEDVSTQSTLTTGVATMGRTELVQR